MKVAVPLFEGDIAPRFGFASQFLFAEIENHRVKSSAYISFEHQDFLRRLEELQSHDVETILCGGFNRSFLPVASTMGLTILDGLTGDSETILRAFAEGTPLLSRRRRRCYRGGARRGARE